MVLVDQNISDMVADGKLISKEFDPENLSCISYDLRIDSIITGENKSNSRVDLLPSEYVIIKTMEELNIPYDVLGRIVERNSLMRMGLRVEGPDYQPGHITYCYLRVQNISKNIITLNSGDKIAQIEFEELKQIPNVTYDKKPGASFNNEKDYQNLGRYEDEYQKNIKSFEDVKEEISSMKEKLYANVLTLMGIMVGVFSLISIDYQIVSKMELSLSTVLTINFSLAFCIALIFGLIHMVIEGPKKKKYVLKYIGILTALIALAVMSFFILK